MRSAAELAAWLAGAAAQYGDPAAPVCQVFCRWQQDLAAYKGDELACGMVDEEFVVALGDQLNLPLPVQKGQYKLAAPGELESYGAELIAPGVWAISPSLNAERLIHAFVVLYDVPDPAPWGEERRILLL